MPTKDYRMENGTPVPGATTVIGAGLAWGKDALMHWAEKMGREGRSHVEERDRAARIGTITHARWEQMMGGPEADLSGYSAADIKESDAPTEALRALKISWGYKPRYRELSIVSEDHYFGGTIDGMGTMNGEGAILDLKTSSQLRPSNIVQLAAYRILAREFLGLRAQVPACYLIHAPRGCKVAKVKRVKAAALDEGEAVFLALLRIYSAEKRLQLKQAFEEER